MDITVETITPASAQEMLAGNTDNRSLRQYQVEKYAADMRADAWLMTGAPVLLNCDGFVIDGQHRLHACIRAGVPFTTVVIRGADPLVREAVDMGIKRTLGDFLRWKGETNVNNLAALINLSLKWEQGLLGRGAQGIGASPHAAMRWLEEHPTARQSLSEGGRVKVAIGGAQPMWATLHLRANAIDPDDCADFYGQLITGAGLLPGSPVLALRSWVANALVGRARPITPIWLATATKAWNYYRDGATVQSLRWRSNGEPFPEPN